ncbi:MAG: type 1 glutamine amidotransferase [Alphaproteobacteria bacterium]|nr:type 1 glutamine amidotransferase [Alphaproteobacteria bacterium]MBU1281028.1 type 1 glutamine amidotransferase [Alphaproteobacteria bacterium]MBU1574996.1 type 1 glutamine amidotransferase [Alphaproteobacteria bacterium]MBU1826869.1 type 1 glutamine amidotransferase [Alphaproteobacteria bacterium]MBU2079077.1 type 1 glutamine amidotransferase [Alphaproteobacteria bacterium]
MKLGILQCGHAPDPVAQKHGDFDHMFTQLLAPYGYSYEVWNVVDMDFPDGPEAADAWLLTGSKHGAYEDHPFIPPLEALIRDIHVSGRRMLGICFGHQIIAKALGGTVEKFKGGWSIGRTAYDIPALGHIHLNAWHQDQVTTLPKGAEVVGQNDFCANAALVYGDSILTIQPHPELSPAIIADYLAARAHDPAYPQDRIAAALDENTKPTDDARFAELMAGFLEHGREALT